MDSVKLGPVKGLRIAVAAFAISIVLFIAVIGGALWLLNTRNSDLSGFATDLRNGLVKSCERTGNPLREAVQKMLRDQIRQSNPAEIRRFFPQIPAAELERLIAEQITRDRTTIRQIAPVDCSNLYPRP